MRSSPSHNVRHRRSRSKSLHHRLVSTLTMPYEYLYLAEDSDQWPRAQELASRMGPCLIGSLAGRLSTGAMQ